MSEDRLGLVPTVTAAQAGIQGPATSADDHLQREDQ